MSHKVYSNGRYSPLMTHMMRPKEVAGSSPDKPAQAEKVRHSGSVAPSINYQGKKMASWVLILTITTSGHAGAIESVPGFASKADCEISGKSWLASVGATAGGWVRPTFVCVK